MKGRTYSFADWMLAGDGAERSITRRLLLGADGVRLDPERFVLTLDPSGHDYEIDLESCTSSAQVLDWLCQIAGKSWSTPWLLGHLLIAFNLLLYPQQNMFNNGRDKRMTARAIRLRMEALVDEVQNQ